MDKNTVAIELAQSLEGTEIAKMVSIGLFTLAGTPHGSMCGSTLVLID
jgi:hypothetical protein